VGWRSPIWAGEWRVRLLLVIETWRGGATFEIVVQSMIAS
jgi:hypothetical protein